MTMDDLQRLFPDMGTLREDETQDGLLTYHNSATCPCHPDACRSLRITTRIREDGQVVALRLNCEAGCSAKEIAQKAGLGEARNILPATRESETERQVVAEVGRANEQMEARENETEKQVESEGHGVLIAREDETERQVVAEVGRASELLAALAEMLRNTNERITEMGQRMAEMEKTVRTLEKVTPQQAGNINKGIRDRAVAICEEYRMGVTVTPVEQGRGSVPEKARFEANGEKVNALAAEIRKDVRKLVGVKATREVARCDYDTVIAYVIDWEDYDKIQRIRKGAKE